MRNTRRRFQSIICALFWRDSAPSMSLTCFIYLYGVVLNFVFFFLSLAILVTFSWIDDNDDDVDGDPSTLIKTKFKHVKDYIWLLIGTVTFLMNAYARTHRAQKDHCKCTIDLHMAQTPSASYSCSHMPFVVAPNCQLPRQHYCGANHQRPSQLMSNRMKTPQTEQQTHTSANKKLR